MTDITTIKNAIKTKLQSVNHLRHVYTYPTGKPDGYPYATISSASWRGEFADFSASSKRNKRTYNFDINIYTDASEAGFGTEKAERISDEAIEEILTAFDMDTTLSGTVLWTQVVSGSSGYEIMGEMARVGTLDIECIKLVDSE